MEWTKVFESKPFSLGLKPANPRRVTKLSQFSAFWSAGSDNPSGTCIAHGDVAQSSGQEAGMFKRGLKLLALTVIAGFPSAAAYGAPIVVTSLTPLTLTLNSSDTTTAGTQATPWLLDETFIAAGAGVLSFTDTDGQPLAEGVSPFSSGSWFTKTVTNNSGIAWTSFEMELQQILGTPSGEGDGLSFAQGAGLSFTSNVFPTFTRIDTTRDYLNFSGGTVANGESVTFSFAATDNSPQSPFFLNQTPNRVDVPVPEPATLTLLGTGLAGWMYRRRRRA